MTKTYAGSCHCGKVRFEAQIDLSAGTNKCNCTYCTKARNWSAIISPEAFRLLDGEEQLGDYTRHPAIHHHFCKQCGVRTFGHADIPEIGGKVVSVSLLSLDDLCVHELLASPVNYCDGRENNWWNRPAEMRHL